MTSPPTEYRPRVTADEAEKNARNTGVISPEMEVSATLVTYSNDTYGDIQEDDTVRPRHQNVQAWAFRTAPVTGVVRGPADAPPQRTSEACPFIFVVNAETGGNVAAFHTCDEESY